MVNAQIYKLLQLVAEIIDSKLIECDDGYAIDFPLSSELIKEIIEREKAKESSKICFLYDEMGNFDKVNIQ